MRILAVVSPRAGAFLEKFAAELRQYYLRHYARNFDHLLRYDD